MNKTVTLLSLAYAISIMAMMNNPAIMAVSPDTKIVLTLLYFVSLVNMALFALGFILEWLSNLRYTPLFRNLRNKFSKTSFSTETVKVDINTFKNDLYLIGDAIHNFGNFFGNFEKDEKGNILVSPDAAKTIAECGSELRLYVGRNTVPNKEVFEDIRKRLHDACHYNGNDNKTSGEEG